MRNKRLTVEQFNSWLTENNRDVTMVVPYIGANKKSTFRCSHNHIWNTTPHNIKHGSGCPSCHGNAKITTREFNEWLTNNRNIIMVGEYINKKTKIEFQCSFGHRWLATPNNIKKGSGCPACAGHGFNPSKPAWLYVIKFNSFIKIGITNDLKRRLKEHTRNGSSALVTSVYYDVGQTALDVENNIKKKYECGFVSKEQCPDGWTETLPIDLMETIIEGIQ